MANHSYVDGPKLKKSDALQTLESAVKSVLGDRLEVVELSDTTKDVHWVVQLPNSAIEDKAEAGSKLLAPGEAYGFLVQYHCDGMWEFRHPFNQWEHWAQNKIQNVIAQVLGVTTYRDDSTDEPIKVDPSELKDSFRAFITRNFKAPYSESDQAWFDKLLGYAPEGFRD